MTESVFEVQESCVLPGKDGLYRVEKFLGEGTYGKVAKCKNLQTNKDVAIKILKQGFDGKQEIKALMEISKIDADEYKLVKCIDWFQYKSHVCIVFELLDQSLSDFMNNRQFRPLSLPEIRVIALQLLIALKGLKNINLVHCDIKPDNIMLVNQVSEPFRVKLVDFGLACKANQIPMGTLRQNLCFRAPELILGLPSDERLDMWTVGYVLALLYTGFYIHPWDSEYNIIRAMVEMQGMPDNKLLDQGLYTTEFFSKTVVNYRLVWKLDTPEQHFRKTGEIANNYVNCWSFNNLKRLYRDQTKIKEVEQFIDLLRRMLEVDPNKRISIYDAFRHPFFTFENRNKPKTSKPHERAAAQVQQAKKVTSVLQRAAANPQQRFRDKNKKSLVQQQKAEKRETPATSRKRKISDQHSQDPENSWQMEAAAKKRKKS